MTQFSEVGDIQCERCGRCLAVCPVYDSERIETLSPRGRLDLIRAVTLSELAPGRRYRESLATCMQCLACYDSCPKGIDASRQILEARTGLAAEGGAAAMLERAFLKTVLMHRPILAGVSRIAAGIQRLFPAREGATSRHLPLFLPEMFAGRRIPTFSPTGMNTRLPEVVRADPTVTRQGHVTFFTGCYFGVVETAPALATVLVLSANGFDVHIPRAQTCCGVVAHMSGHDDLARRVAERNLAVLAGSGPVVTGCATCGNGLRREYPVLFKDEKVSKDARRLAEDLAARTVDIHEFLAELPNLKHGSLGRNHKVTVHDPCHLSRGQKVHRAVRQILAAVRGVDIIEMRDAGVCCGGGGLSGLKNPVLSRSIGERKMASIEETGADMVAAGCPGCLIQIRDLLSRRNSSIRAVHPIELLARSYR